MDTKLDQVQHTVRSVIEPSEARQHAMDGELSAHENGHQRDAPADDGHEAQRGTETVLKQVKRELAMVEAEAPVPPPARAGWDRAPNRTGRGSDPADAGGGRCPGAGRRA